MASKSALIVEGVVVDKEPFKYKSRDTGRTSRFMLYTLEASYFLRGSEESAVQFRPRSIEMNVGNSFFSRQSRVGGYAAQVWTASDGKFYPYPGLV